MTNLPEPFATLAFWLVCALINGALLAAVIGIVRFAHWLRGD